MRRRKARITKKILEKLEDATLTLLNLLFKHLEGSGWPRLWEHSNLSTNLVGWILNFWTKRTQRVRVNGVWSIKVWSSKCNPINILGQLLTALWILKRSAKLWVGRDTSSCSVWGSCPVSILIGPWWHFFHHAFSSTFSLASRFGNLPLKQRSSLNQTMKRSDRLIGEAQLCLESLCTEELLRHASSIPNNVSRPLAGKFQPLPSGRRFIVPRTRTSR